MVGSTYIHFSTRITFSPKKHYVEIRNQFVMLLLKVEKSTKMNGVRVFSNFVGRARALPPILLPRLSPGGLLLNLRSGGEVLVSNCQ